MKNELITIIVPIYNVEKYLSRCVESIRNQTYENLEIILVDDGATDSCPAICDEYAKEDTRIKVIHKKNGGLSDARNAALDICTGDYVLCVDSDDFMELDTVEMLYQTAVRNGCDISTCRYVNYYDGPVELNREQNEELVLDTATALENMFYQTNVTTSAWGKLYRRELFEGIRYPKGKICEDLDTTYKLFSRSPKVVINSAKKFYYQQRTDSIINSHFSLKRMDALTFAKDQMLFVEKHHPSATRAAQNRYFVEAIFILVQIPLRDRSLANARRECNEVIKKYRRNVITDNRSRPIYRLYAFMSLLFGSNNMVRAYNAKATLQTHLERIK